MATGHAVAVVAAAAVAGDPLRSVNGCQTASDKVARELIPVAEWATRHPSAVRVLKATMRCPPATALSPEYRVRKPVAHPERHALKMIEVRPPALAIRTRVPAMADSRSVANAFAAKAMSPQHDRRVAVHRVRAAAAPITVAGATASCGLRTDFPAGVMMILHRLPVRMTKMTRGSIFLVSRKPSVSCHRIANGNAWTTMILWLKAVCIRCSMYPAGWKPSAL